MRIDVVINTDDKYLQHAMVMLCSLYENNLQHVINVHVLHKNLSTISMNYLLELSERYNNKTLFYTIDDKILEGVQFRKNRPLSVAAYYRLLLSSVLPQTLEKVLYLDCDMIIMQDIQEIFSIEIGNFALAATLDNFPYSEQHRLQLHMEVGERTFCSGIMMVNLKYWRENNVEPGLLEYAKRHREVVFLHDQDVLNYYFKKKWFLLPPKWNRSAGQLRAERIPLYKIFDLIAYVKKPMVFHYSSVGVKPWYDAHTPERNLYLKYLHQSKYKEVVFDKKSNKVKCQLYLLTIRYNIKKMVQKCLLSNSITERWGI